jgi:hypothetical protein
MTCNRSAITAGAAVVLCALACDFEARAQQFPTQPVHLILDLRRAELPISRDAWSLSN